MAKIIILIATILLVQLAAANTAPAEDDNMMINIINTVQTKVTETGRQILNFFDIHDNNDAAEKIVSEGKVYASKLSGLIDDIKEKAKSSTGELSESVTHLTNKLTEIVDKLGEDSPQMKQYRETLESSLNTVVEETKKFATQAEPINEDVKQVLQNVLTSTNKLAGAVTTTVADAIKSA